MKKGIFGFPLLCFLMMSLFTPAFAADHGYCGGEGDGTNLAWTIDDAGTLTISGNGNMADFNSIPWYSGRISGTEIVNVVIQDGVTNITNSAFSGSRNLTKVTLPDTLMTIGANAFEWCENLVEINIPVNVTTIGDSAFYYCRNLSQIVLPDSVTIIGERAFGECENLTEITIPSRVTQIAPFTFDHCRRLAQVSIPDSVTSIGNGAFSVCESLVNITIPNHVSNIESATFNGCTSLLRVNIPDGVTNIGDSAFSKCESLLEIHIPTTCKQIDSLAFQGCAKLTDVTIPEGISSLEYRTFENCQSLLAIHLPISLVNIGEGVFHNCGSLNDVYYSGSEADWEEVSVMNYFNDNFFSATVHYREVVSSYVVTVNNGSGSGSYSQGDSVAIRADTPSNGRQFKEWRGADDLTFTNGSALEANASFTMPSRNVTITATYEDIPRTSYVVTVNQGSGSGSYAQGEAVTIIANTPESGKRFKEWTGASGLTFTSGSAITSTATFIMPGNAVNITATYESVLSTTYTVTVNNGLGSGSYSQGDMVTIRANPAPSGKQFKEWSGASGLSFTNGSASSANAAFAMPSRNVTITATYRDESYFDEPIHQAPNLEKLISATSALIHEYEYVADSSDPDDEFASGRLIVDADKTLPDLGQFNVAQIVVTSDLTYLIQFYNAGDAERCARYLDSLSYVSYTEPDGVITADIALNPPFVPQASATYNSWGVTATKSNAYVEFLRNKGISSSVTVAVVDTGVDSTHPFLNGRILSGYDLIDDDYTPQDGNKHGTHVSGTIVDCTLGLNVKILPVRVLDNEGSGPFSIVGQGIRYAVDHSAKVINLSLGGSHSDYVDSAIDYALSKNVTVVVAAGNEGESTNYHCPAHIQNCITVAAVDSSKSRAYFSNYGNAVDIAAPGVAIKSSVPGGGYQNMDGTSMATPHVAAAAAMLLYENGNQTPAQIEKRLRDAAVDLGATGWDQYYGAGFLSLEKFIGISFSDVPIDAYFYKPVMWAIERGITNGTTNTTFSPHEVCTTAQILTFIWRAVGEPEPASSFGISSDLYYSKAMRWATEQGIRGMYATNEANSACTRASAMVYLWGLAGKPAAGSNPFIDVPLGAGYASAISWGVGRGVTNGTTENTFSPLTLCTRAQIITFLYRYYVESV